MNKLSLTEPYSVDELADELNLSTKLRNGIRRNFGDPVSINDLKQITQREFLDCKWFGRKSWWEFKEALSEFCISNCAISLINRTSVDSVIVEIDTSRPFSEVIRGLVEIMSKGRCTPNQTAERHEGIRSHCRVWWYAYSVQTLPC